MYSGQGFQRLMQRLPSRTAPQPQAQAPAQGINRPMMQPRPQAPQRPSQPQRLSPGVYRQADGSLTRGNQAQRPAVPQMNMPNMQSQMAQALAGNFQGGQPQYQQFAPAQMPMDGYQTQQGQLYRRPMMMSAQFDPNRGY